MIQETTVILNEMPHVLYTEIYRELSNTSAIIIVDWIDDESYTYTMFDKSNKHMNDAATRKTYDGTKFIHVVPIDP